jgi:MSHA pilin protein MshA
MNRRSEAGFTIIELVVVIALLGLLAAVALPRFTNLRTEAQAAAFEGVKGGFASAVALSHAQWLAQNSPATILLEGSTTPITMNASGWPDLTAVGQTAADDLYGLLMQGSMPAGWIPGTDPGPPAGVTLALGVNTFTYEDTNGTVQ